MQQGVLTDATCNIQQWLELLANNVAPVCMGLNKLNSLGQKLSTNKRARNGLVIVKRVKPTCKTVSSF